MAIDRISYFYGTLLIAVFLCFGLAGCADKAITFEPTDDFEEFTGDVPYDAEYEADAEEQTIYVYVCGFVKNAGVYELEMGSRVFDALSMAGGLTDDACTDYVNLAREATDGEMIYFPSSEEVRDGIMPSTENTGADTNVININTATVYELTSLRGIGESRACDIVAYRQENGPFENIEDIMKVSGIKESLFSKIKDNICVR